MSSFFLSFLSSLGLHVTVHGPVGGKPETLSGWTWLAWYNNDYIIRNHKVAAQAGTTGDWGNKRQNGWVVRSVVKAVSDGDDAGPTATGN